VTEHLSGEFKSKTGICVLALAALASPLVSGGMIHPTALIDPLANLHPSVEVGAYAIIEGPVRLGEGVRVEAHAQVIGQTTVGADCRIGRGAIIGGDPQDLGFDPKTSSGVVLGERNQIREHVTIHRGSKPGSMTRMGQDNYLMAGAHLAHDVVLGDKNILANAALLAGHVQVGSHTFIGGGAGFHQFIRLGDHCIIQGNGRYTQDIPHFCSAHGNNVIAGMNIIGMRRSGFTAADRAAVKAAFDLLYRSGLNLSQALAQAERQSWAEPAERFIHFFRNPSRKGVARLRASSKED
jgi:UDP-N-acetylglucosamine acyltransferase